MTTLLTANALEISQLPAGLEYEHDWTEQPSRELKQKNKREEKNCQKSNEEREKQTGKSRSKSNLEILRS